MPTLAEGVPAFELSHLDQVHLFADVMAKAGSMLTERTVSLDVRLMTDGAALYGDSVIRMQAEDGRGGRTSFSLKSWSRGRTTATKCALVSVIPGENSDDPDIILGQWLAPGQDGDLHLKSSRAFDEGASELIADRAVQPASVVDMLREVRMRGTPLRENAGSPVVGSYSNGDYLMARADWAVGHIGRLLHAVGSMVERGVAPGNVLTAEAEFAVSSIGHIERGDSGRQHMRLQAYNKRTKAEGSYYFAIEPSLLPEHVTNPPGETALVTAASSEIIVRDGRRVQGSTRLYQHENEARLRVKGRVGDQARPEPEHTPADAEGIVAMAERILQLAVER